MTTDPRHVEDLIRADLDGELSAAGRAELARLLLADPETRRLHEELTRTEKLLRKAPRATPPPGVRSAILAALKLPEARVASGGTPWPALRLAAAIVGGLLVVGIGYRMLDTTLGGRDLQGSLEAALPSQAREAATRLDGARFSGEGVEASATLHREDQGLSLALDLGGSTDYDVTARFDPKATVYRSDVDLPGVTFTDDTVTVHVEPGQQSRTLTFTGTAPILVRVVSGGKLIGEQELSVGAGHN